MSGQPFETKHPLSRLLADDTLDDRLRACVEQLHAHLVGCSSCSTCESTGLAWALDALLNALRDGGEQVSWTAQDIRIVLAEILL